MSVLHEGSAGPEVATLQAQLQEIGFSPGPWMDGFGLATKAAVLAFQKSAGLVSRWRGWAAHAGALTGT